MVIVAAALSPQRAREAVRRACYAYAGIFFLADLAVVYSPNMFVRNGLRICMAPRELCNLCTVMHKAVGRGTGEVS
jgi:hypothetical protein